MKNIVLRDYIVKIFTHFIMWPVFSFFHINSNYLPFVLFFTAYPGNMHFSLFVFTFPSHAGCFRISSHILQFIKQ